MTATQTGSGPLAGIKVLDMTQVVMGPFATQVLADFGADVIKIEPPTGDSSRRIPPMRNTGMGTVYLHANRNKRSVVLDLKQPQGVEAFLRLIETADVLVCNVRAAAMDRLGLDYARLQAINPRLVYLNLVGFGLSGPYANRPAYEDLFQGLTGVSSMLTMAGADAPMFVPLAFNDRACGLSAANIVLAALLHRATSGRGQHIVMPMFETMVQFVLGDHMGGRTFDPPIGPMGYERVLNDLRRPYPTRDGHICMVLYSDRDWRAFLAIVGKESWIDEDPRLADFTSRAQNAREIYRPVVELMKTRRSAEWLALLEAADIPCAPVHTLDSVMDDPHLKATGFFQTVDHPTEGRIVQMGATSTWSETPPEGRRPAPRVGQDSASVLSEVGYSDEEIQGLCASGVSAIR